MYKQMGAVIRRLREQRGWSLGDMAERMNYRRGADASGLQRLERGTKRAPLDLYSAVALALEAPLSELVAAAEREGGLSPDVLLPDEKRLIAAYRVMEPETRYHLDAVADALSKGNPDAETTD
jgi:transcriptional regulator with XRE-family HTH domain